MTHAPIVKKLAWMAGGAFLFALLPAGPVAQAVREVVVLNFPDVQQVRGEVGLTEPVKLASMRAFENITVPPVNRSQTTRLVDAGLLVTEGFPSVVLSVHGVVKGSVQRTGSIGVILLPEQETIREAFVERGILHFTLETEATGVTSASPYFASRQPRYTVAFSSYRVLLYNTTDKTVDASVFAYLSN